MFCRGQAILTSLWWAAGTARGTALPKPVSCRGTADAIAGSSSSNTTHRARGTYGRKGTGQGTGETRESRVGSRQHRTGFQTIRPIRIRSVGTKFRRDPSGPAGPVELVLALVAVEAQACAAVPRGPERLPLASPLRMPAALAKALAALALCSAGARLGPTWFRASSNSNYYMARIAG